MKTITFSSIKGGVGKTSISILVSNYLASAGSRVLFIDLDLQNSASFYYLDDPDCIDDKNIALALQSGDLAGNALPANYFGIDIIPSHFSIVNLRSINTKTLSRWLQNVDGYDFCIIDCSPSWDNLVLNGINAADLILTPVRLSQFDWKGCRFLKSQIELETDKIDNWEILINFYRSPKTDNADSLGNQYLSLFQSTFSNIHSVMIPETSMIQKCIDTKEKLTAIKSKEKLFNSIGQLANSFTENVIISERF